MKTLIIDNYDSFTFNLYQLAGEITGVAPVVVPNDSIEWESAARGDFGCVIISPGPGRPDRQDDFGSSKRAILEMDIPLLGVCLGHQGICHLFGGDVIHAPEPMHGRLSTVYHDGSELFTNVPNPFTAMRYHSLACAQPLPQNLAATAWTADGVVMALAHRERPLWGVQFHPESIATEHGRTILTNFIELARKRRWPTKGDDNAWRPPRGAGTLACSRALLPACCPSGSGVFDGAATTLLSSRGAASRRLSVERVPAKVDAAQLFTSLFAHQDNAFWLDSSLTSASHARFSFLGGGCETLSTGGEDILTSLDRHLRESYTPSDDLPFDFNCGYVGYLGYELNSGSRLLFVDKCIAIDHQTDEVYLLHLGPGAQSWFDQIKPCLERQTQLGPPRLPAQPPRFTMGRSRETYLDDIARCLAYIRDGESYEVCLTNQLHGHFAGDPFEFYRVLRAVNPAPYSAYLKFPGMAIACSSPERFLKVWPDGMVESKPIKGTMRRGVDATEDEYLRQRLRLDIKNQAENLMIVDLLRNDLGKVCEFGSVKVPALMHVETYATVHQLVSTITGQLRGDCGAADCVRAAFPGGSMTGAPKLRTMAIIDELEHEPRGVYSGSIGYFGLNGSADLNIVIRTAVFRGQCVSIGAGGAIVAMSDPEEEWNEILLKAQALLAAFVSRRLPASLSPLPEPASHTLRSGGGLSRDEL